MVPEFLTPSKYQVAMNTSWEQNRKSTFYTYLLCCFINGMEYNVVLVTIIPYLEELVQTDNVQFYYGLCICTRYLVSMVIDLFIGRSVDRSRDVKQWICASAGFAVVGNLIYCVYLSPVCLVVGRAISGAGDAVFSVMIGEVMRTYETDKATRVLWFLLAACSVGYTIGSWINLTFTRIHFQIGSFLVTQYNFVGIFMTVSYVISICVVYTYAYNCSKEYDKKSDNEKSIRTFSEEDDNNIGKIATRRDFGDVMSENSPILQKISKQYSSSLDLKRDEHERHIEARSCSIVQFHTTHELIVPLRTRLHSLSASLNCTRSHTKCRIDNKYIEDETPSLYIILKYFTSQPQILLILISTFVFAYALGTIDLFGPLLVLKIYHWSSESLNVLYTVNSIIYFLVLLFLSRHCITNQRVYRLSIACIVLLIASLLLLLCMTELNNLCTTQKIMLLVAYLISELPVWLLDEIATSNLLARMVPSGTQCFAEAVRSSLSRASHIFSSLTIAIDFELKYWICAMVGVLEIFLLLFLLYRKRLTNIQTIEFY